MRVVLGVGGGIAAYKAAEVARALQQAGCTVEVVMTAAAQKFVQPLTFAALTGRKVSTGLWHGDSPEETLSSAIEHIRVARENDILLVAPATADLLAKFAAGIADDFLTTTYLAFSGPVVLAPAMNTQMWDHPATRANIATLRGRGHAIVEPPAGLLACGEVGPGRLAEHGAITAAVLDAAAPTRTDLDHEVVVVTAGPTREPLDPGRYISNRSSGKMGYALAAEAAARGARVVLISGPVTLSAPAGVEVLRVNTAREMRQAVLDHLEAATMIIKAAAVADYHVTRIPEEKLKKTAARLSLELDLTPDILAELGQRKGDRLLIGFAAETTNLIEEARRKLSTKNCDIVVANLVGGDSGFESDDNEVVLVLKTGDAVPLARASKRVLAGLIFDHALRLRLALHASAS